MGEDVMREEGTLPRGWVEAPIGEVAQLLRGVSYEKSAVSEEPKDGYFPILRATNIQDEMLILDSNLVYVPERFVKPEQLLKPGDVVICMSSGSKHLVGKTAQLEHEWTGSFGTFCAAARFHATLDHEFAAFFFSSTQYRNLIREKSSGININNLRHSDIESLLIPLPPPIEQRRIVAEIEKQFTRLDAGVAALKRVQANLKRYRASVLKAACEGRLAPQDPADEPADRLLARILAERRARWEAAHPGKRYVEPAAPVTAGLPELPEGWCWASLGQLAWDSGYGTSEKCDYEASGPPVLRIPNIVRGRIDLSDLKYAISPTKLKLAEALQPGDLLIIRTNGSRDLIGRSAVVRDSFTVPHHFASYLIRYRIVGREDLPAWINTIWDTGFLREWIEKVAATSAGQYNVSMNSLSKLPIPLPPLPEQHRIVAEVERRLSVVAALEATVAANLARAGRLRQAVLKRAFEGLLVGQDARDGPTSYPASVETR